MVTSLTERSAARGAWAEYISGMTGSRLMRARSILLISSALLFHGRAVAAGPSRPAQRVQVQSRIAVATGWFPWYEVKTDPENAHNVILCGSRWDAPANALYGFVYASSDGGKTWHVALDDRATTWVSETSCAFGPQHRAYFLSEASQVIDGVPHHHFGTTRLFVSADSGQHWAEASRTAWADYSTSAVNVVSGDLVTFYNNSGTHDAARNWGSTIGLLRFSSGGKTISGPFLDRDMKERNYVGVFPSDAVALKDGTVAALFFGARDTSDGREYDLGLERAGVFPSSAPSFRIIASEKKCLNLDGYSLMYDAAKEDLLVAYGEEAAAGCRLVLADSRDAGATWTRRTLPQSDGVFGSGIGHVSLAQEQDGALGLLWEDAGTWRFTSVIDSAVSEPAIELASGGKETPITNDSLMTVIYEPENAPPQGGSLDATLHLNVRAMTGVVWRASGLIASGNAFYAVSPNVVPGGEGLFWTVLSAPGEGAPIAKQEAPPSGSTEDVTKQIVLLYGRAQSFDKITGTLSVDVKLGNRGDTPVHAPIQLQVNQISSRAGKASILNADNGLTGAGAIWNLSGIVVGDQIPPQATTYNTFRLSFHIEVTGPIPTYNLLDVGIKVLAAK